eukprot:6492022-Amphidinium_carterae.2
MQRQPNTIRMIGMSVTLPRRARPRAKQRKENARGCLGTRESRRTKARLPMHLRRADWAITGYDPEAGAVEYQAQVYFASVMEFDEDEVHDDDACPSNWTSDNGPHAGPRGLLEVVHESLLAQSLMLTSTCHLGSVTSARTEPDSALGDTSVATHVEVSMEISDVVTDVTIMFIADVKTKMMTFLVLTS